MSIQVLYRRGNTAQHSTFTGAAGEITIDTTKNIVVVHDGTTVGGHPLLGSGNAVFSGVVAVNGSISIGNSTSNATVNSTAYTGTANNALYLGGTIASGYQTTAGLTANVTAIALTVTANNTNYVGTTPAAQVINTSSLATNLGDYTNSALLFSNLANYQTLAGLASNVALIAANSATYLGGNTAADLRSYADDKAANAYSNAVAYTGLASAAYTNAVSYTDTKIGTANTAITANAATAYTNAVSYTDGKISTANSAITGNAATAYTNAVSYTDGKISTANSAITANAATAYTNAVSYTDGKISTANSAITGNAATAYTNAVSYTDGKISTANSAITANAATAYTNAVSYTDGKISTANSAITANAATAYTNAVSYTDGKISTANSAITGNAATAYSNATSYTDTKIGTANTAITANAATAYTNATSYASNATNISSGTINEARLPYRMNQNVSTGNNVTFANISLTGGTVSTLPVNSTDIVNKQYADAIASGVNFHPAVRLSTTVAFDATTATYNNGNSGVGATITDNSPYIAISLDGVTANYGDRILMRTVSNTAWNGIYVVSNTGSASYPWVLTRSFDYDQIGSGSNEIDQGDLIYVLAGSTLAGTSWVQQQTVTTIGTDSITFAQFSSKALYALSEGSGLYWSVGAAYDGSAASTLAVNTTYISTLSANNASYLNSKTEANLNVNSAVNANNANNSSYLNSKTEANLNVNSAVNSNTVTTGGSKVVANSSGLYVNSAMYLAGSNGASGQVLTSNGTGNVYWSTLVGVNTASQYTFTNTITFSNTITVGAINANGQLGTAGQILSSNGSTTYWATSSGSPTSIRQQFTGDGNTQFAISGGYTPNEMSVFLNGVLMRNGTDVTVSSGANVVFAVAPGTGAVIDAIGSLSTTVYTPNVAAQYTWSNTQTFSNTITFSSTINGTANNASYLGGTVASGYQTTAGLSSNVATLTANAAGYLNSKTEANLNVNSAVNANSANNSSYLGGVAAASYVNTSGNYTISGNLNFNASNTYFTTTLYVGGQIVIGASGDVVLANGSGIQANGVWGSAGQALLNDGSGNDYWGNPYAANSATYANSSSTNTFTVGTAAYFVANGNLGIGTTSPGTYGKLEVTGTGYVGTSVRSTDASGVAAAFAAYSSSDARLTVLTNHPLLMLTNNTERMRIDSSGNVGIGTSSPAAKLDIGSGNLNFSSTAQRITGDFSNATLTSRVSFQSSTTNGTTAVQVIPNGTATQTQFALYSDPAITNGNYGDLTLSNVVFRFRTNLLGTGTAVPMTFEVAGSERMRIDTSGNVGIGNTAPTDKLSVTGDIRASANLYGTLATTSQPYITANNASYLGGVAAASYANTSGAYTFTGIHTYNVGGNTIYFSNTTSNWISWGTGGVAAPSVTTKSAGTKLVLYEQTSSSSVDYAIGVEGYHLWFSTTTTAGGGFKWYANTTNIMTANTTGLHMTGTLAINSTGGALVANNSSYLGGTAAASYVTTSSIGGLSANNASYLGGVAAASYVTTSTIGGLSANNAAYLGGTAAASYVTTSSIGGLAIKRVTSPGNIDFNNAAYFQAQVVGFEGTPTNGPSGVTYSTMLVLQERPDTAAQLVVNYNTGTFYTRGIYVPTSVTSGNSPTYAGWRTHLNDSNYATYVSQLTALGVGTAASATTGEIRATNNITAYYSDERLKENIAPIVDALAKVNAISGITYNSNDLAEEYGYTDRSEQVGVLAQEIQKVLPHAVKHAPFDIGQNDDGTEYSKSGETYLTVQYEKLVPLLIEAIKELTNRIEKLESK